MLRSRHLMITACAAALFAFPQGASAGFGELDDSFGSGTGKLELPVSMTPGALIIQPDGKIVVSGNSKTIRLLTDGSPDVFFGANGVVNAAISRRLSDGRFIGWSGANALVMYGPDGAIDPSFGNAGVLAFGDEPTSFYAASIAVQGDSHVLVSGRKGKDAKSTSLMRINNAGEIDGAFGDAGLATVPGHKSWPGLSAVATQSNGNILLGLDRENAPTSELTAKLGIAQFSADGVRKMDFGVNGIAATRPVGDVKHGVAELVVAENDSFAAINEGFMYGSRGSARVYTGISLHRRDGSSATSTSNYYSFETSAAARVSGSGLVATAGRELTVLDRDFRVDPRFDGDGTVTASVNKCSSWRQVAADELGRITAAGSTCDGRLVIARFLGYSGGRGALQPQIRSFIRDTYYRGSVSRPWLHTVSGIAGPVPGVKRVGVAIRRFDERLLKKRKCVWLTRAGTSSTTRPATASGECLRPAVMPAKGVAKCKFKLRRPLPGGRYRLYVRASAPNRMPNALNNDFDASRRFNVFQR
jgi:uncharacterized delta-60 repeat protein